jgi:hypothetical protein
VLSTSSTKAKGTKIGGHRATARAFHQEDSLMGIPRTLNRFAVSPVRKRLSVHFDVPVWVNNDVNIMALGEQAEGSSRMAGSSVGRKVAPGTLGTSRSTSIRLSSAVAAKWVA